MGSDSGACAGCGSSLPSDAAYCARCGRRRAEEAPTPVELKLLAASPRSPDSAYSPRNEQSAVVAMRRPDARRLLVLLAVVAAVGLLAIAIGGLVLDDSDPAASSPTTSAPSTSTTTAVTAPTTTRVSVDASGASGAPTTVAPPVTRPIGPVLDPEQRAWSIYVSDARFVRRIDLATGQVIQRDLAGLVGDYHLVGVVAGRLVFDTPLGGVQSLAADLAGDVRSHPIWAAGVGGTSAIAGDLLWSIRYDDRAKASVATLTDLDANIHAAMTIPQVDYPVGFVGQRALITRGGRTYTLGTSGTYEVYANGEVVAAHNGYVLWVGCDDAARCAYHVGDASHPDLGITSIPASRELRVDRQELGLAPDGQAAVVINGQTGDRSLVKLTTGSEVPLGTRVDDIEWTPDGSWLVTLASGGVSALNVRDGRIMSYDLGITNLRSATIDMVIG